MLCILIPVFMLVRWLIELVINFVNGKPKEQQVPKVVHEDKEASADGGLDGTHSECSTAPSTPRAVDDAFPEQCFVKDKDA